MCIRDSTNTVTLAATPTPYYRMISNGVSWRVQGEGATGPQGAPGPSGLSTTDLTLIHQNWTIAGGGTVTIRNIGNTALYIRWSTRILVTPLCNKVSSNYYNIECPTTGSIGTGELTPMTVFS